MFICGRLKKYFHLNRRKSPSRRSGDGHVQDPLFDQAMIVGEGKPYLASLLVLNSANGRILEQPRPEGNDPDSLVHSLRELRLNRLKPHCAFSKVRRIRAVHLARNRVWENGLLTPTLKLKLRNGKTFRGQDRRTV